MIYACSRENPRCVELADRLPERLGQWSCQLLAAEVCYGIDPYLLAAIIDRESLGGNALKPRGPGGRGDFDQQGVGHGHGLGQIDDRSHHWFVQARFDDGGALWADPTFNILYAARLLRKNLAATLSDWPTAIAAYNAGLARAQRAVEHLTRPMDQIAALPLLDAITTGGNYVTDILQRRTEYLQGSA